jgi:hypothetical protein
MRRSEKKFELKMMSTRDIGAQDDEQGVCDEWDDVMDRIVRLRQVGGAVGMAQTVWGSLRSAASLQFANMVTWQCR